MEKNEQALVEEKFYQDVADLLQVHHDYRFNINKGWRTRWNNRKPGNGRFEGYGLVRYFGPSLIHMVFSTPEAYVNKTFTSADDALAGVKEFVDTLLLVS